MITALKSAPSYMYITSEGMEVFRGASFHEEANDLATGLLTGDFTAIAEKYLLLDGKPLRLDWYQKQWMREPRNKLCEKSRRIGMTEISTLKKTLASQFIPNPYHMISLTQKHTHEMMDRHEGYWDQIPSRLRAKRIVDTKEYKRYLVHGDAIGAHLSSDFYGHPCSSKSLRGLKGNIDVDEFAFYPLMVSDSLLKTIIPILATKWSHVDDSSNHYEINIISTHFGEGLFWDLCEGHHEFASDAVRMRLPFTCSHRVASEIATVAKKLGLYEFYEEMCCVAVAAKSSPLPRKLFDYALTDMEFDQWGVVVERDQNGSPMLFDRSEYRIVSLGCDYASFTAETTFWAWGLRDNGKIDCIVHLRMNPDNYGGSIEEDEIWRVADELCRMLAPDYFGYDATGVGKYLSRVLFDPAYGDGDDRRPRTDKYPYAEIAEPIKITADFKSAEVTKLQMAFRNHIITKIPLEIEIIRQLQLFKRTVSSTGNVKFAAEGKGKNEDANDDIVLGMMLALRPIPIEMRPTIYTPPIVDHSDVEIFQEIQGLSDILTRSNIINSSN